MKKQFQKLLRDDIFLTEELGGDIPGYIALLGGRGYVTLDRGDVESFMTGNELLSLGIGSGKGDHREIDALDDVLKQVWKPAKGLECSQCLMFIEYGQPELTMDELTGIVDGLRAKMGDGINVVWGVGCNPVLNSRVEVLVMVGWNFRA